MTFGIVCVNQSKDIAATASRLLGMGRMTDEEKAKEEFWISIKYDISKKSCKTCKYHEPNSDTLELRNKTKCLIPFSAEGELPSDASEFRCVMNNYKYWRHIDG